MSGLWDTSSTAGESNPGSMVRLDAYGVPGGQTVYFHGADITQYKRVEKEQNELRLKLVQNDKMASIGQLAAGIAHEINNPLSFVVLNLNHIANYGRGLLKIVEQYDKVATLVKREHHK